MKLSKRAAETLMTEIRTGLVNVEALIIKAIEGRAWEVLGYSSFVEMWNDRMQGVRLATEGMRAVVVYAMFDAGLNPEEVVEQTQGQIGDRAAKSLFAQKKRGIPPKLATTRVRSYERSSTNCEPKTVRIEVGNDVLVKYKGIAEARGLVFEDECAKALDKHFRALERARRAA